MNLTVTLATPGLTIVWPITVDDLFEMTDVFTTALGQPTVTREGEPYDIEERVRLRMGQIGSPQRRITVEPEEQPREAPEPIATPTPEREPIPA
jgi:hypothetical protein